LQNWPIVAYLGLHWVLTEWKNISNATVMSVSLYKKILVQVNIGKLLLKTLKIVKGQKYPIFGPLLGTF